MRRTASLLALGLLLLHLPVLSGTELGTDQVMVRYPAGFTKLLVVDLAPFLTQPQLSEGVIEPLTAASHPLAGIVRTIGLLRIPPERVSWVAHGEGPDVTGFSLIEGPPFAQTFGALQGLRAAAGAPGSPYTHWDLETFETLSVVFVGGVFGPVAIEWAYIPIEGALWVGTEIAFQPGKPSVARLRATAEKIVSKLLGQRGSGSMDELLIGVQVRGGQAAFVRASAPDERFLEAGEQAMGFTLNVAGDQVGGRFVLRFESEEAAIAAADRLTSGSSPYLAQGIYQAQLVNVQCTGRVLVLDVATGLRGLVGLLLLVMPF
ncbi:MAG: hypothetical protein A2Z21_06010 [Candidatus Fraserbacteria bacterium RBG_16_55_9]|uniref:Uncharacterized protein n=1 Tax=Fraserbacteria sp. (strain RBG_16_55_9) TaxID=1817864 RepID=A0A1F5UZZ4_FRAXR|nr:MAG: hypothetical protein A2Z21_06010 [Candidatus Fraserbacteria bacterium RBG_16_55_9]